MKINEIPGHRSRLLHDVRQQLPGPAVAAEGRQRPQGPAHGRRPRLDRQDALQGVRQDAAEQHADDHAGLQPGPQSRPVRPRRRQEAARHCGPVEPGAANQHLRGHLDRAGHPEADGDDRRVLESDRREDHSERGRLGDVPAAVPQQAAEGRVHDRRSDQLLRRRRLACRRRRSSGRRRRTPRSSATRSSTTSSPSRTASSTPTSGRRSRASRPTTSTTSCTGSR